MKTVLELKIFKNGGSNAIRLPASLNLSESSIFLEIDDESNDLVLKRQKPNRFDSFFALQAKLGPLTDEEWSFERDNEPEPTRQSIQDLIDAK